MWMQIGDLHLTDRVQDQYRFGIFDWIKKQQLKRDVAATFLAGDITDGKDRHSATLVNKIVAGLTKLKPPVYIVMGNHDYRDPKNPFFKFLNHIEGIKFITVPTVIDAVRPMALIPHYRTQDEFDDAVRLCSTSKPAAFLVHQTFEGAIAESGVRLSGLGRSLVESLKPPLGVYAGDVHKPQTQGLVTYIGCPYQVRFGDNFEPRCIHVSRNGTEAYPWFEAPRKHSLTVRGPENILNNSELYAGDQVKLTIELAREESVEWQRIKQEVLAACRKLKLEVFGAKIAVNTVKGSKHVVHEKRSTTVQEVLELFCKSEKVPTSTKHAGMEILNGNKTLL